MARVQLTRRARQQIVALPSSLQDAVVRAIDRIAANPRVGVTATGRMRGQWVLGVGSYRIVYTLERGDAVIIRSIRHRAVVYRSHSGRRRR